MIAKEKEKVDRKEAERKKKEQLEGLHQNLGRIDISDV